MPEGQEGYKYGTATKQKNLSNLYQKFMNFSKINGKQTTIYMTVIAIIVFFGIAGMVTTGLSTQREQLQSQLTNTQAGLNDVIAQKTECQKNVEEKNVEIAECNDKMNSTQTYLVECEKTRDEFKENAGELSSLLNDCSVKRDTYKNSTEKLIVDLANCISERNTYKTVYDNFTFVVQQISGNAAKQMCCLGQQNRTISWKMVDYNVVCGEGPNTVSC